MIKLAIVGSRNLSDIHWVDACIKENYNIEDIELIISGGAIGIDSDSEAFAKRHNIPTLIIRPDYDTYGKSAPFRRNTEIVKACDCLIAFCLDNSNGTMDSVNKAKEMGKEVTEYHIHV